MPQAEGNVDTPIIDAPVVDANKPLEAAKSDAQKPAPVAGKTDGVMSDRERGLLADTKREREARQALEKTVNELKTNYERERKRIKLLTSDDPKTDEEEEIAVIQAQFAKVYPHLAKLSPEQVDRFLKSQEQNESATEVVNSHWEQHAIRVTESLVEQISEHTGDLSPRQRTRVIGQFASYVESTPELYARYKKGDAKLVTDFVTEYVEDFITPAKRQATSQEVNRFSKPVPRGGGRDVRSSVQPKKIDFNDPKAVEDAMVASYQSHGGTFKR